MFRTISLLTEAGDNLVDITARVREIVKESGVREGICHLSVPHTTAAIAINSALDPNTATDLVVELKKLVPTRVDFAHQYDTPADAAGHVKSVLVGTTCSLPIHEADLVLGSSQSILFYEFDGPRNRQVNIVVIG